MYWFIKWIKIQFNHYISKMYKSEVSLIHIRDESKVSLIHIRDELIFHLGKFGLFIIIDNDIVWTLYNKTKSGMIGAKITCKYDCVLIECMYKNPNFHSIIGYNSPEFVLWLKKYWNTELNV